MSRRADSLNGEITDGRHWWIENAPQLWEGCAKLNEELKELYPVLIAPGGHAGRRRTDDAPDVLQHSDPYCYASLDSHGPTQDIGFVRRFKAHGNPG